MDIITGKVIHYDIIEVCVHNHHLFSLFPLNNNIQTFQKHKVNIIRSLFETKNISFILDCSCSFIRFIIDRKPYCFSIHKQQRRWSMFWYWSLRTLNTNDPFSLTQFFVFQKILKLFFFFYWLWTEHRRVSQFNSLIEWKWMSPFDLFIHFLGQKVCLINFRLKVVVDDSIQHILLRREYWLPLA